MGVGMGLQWIEYLKQSGWMDLLKVGGVAGVVSSVVTLSWNELREARVSRRKARHVALTVALSLESYRSTHRLADCRESGWRAIVVDTSIFDAYPARDSRAPHDTGSRRWQARPGHRR